MLRQLVKFPPLLSTVADLVETASCAEILGHVFSARESWIRLRPTAATDRYCKNPSLLTRHGSAEQTL